MLISLNWLKDFVDIPKKITPEDLGLLLTTHTVEIDGVENQAEKFKNVVVGKILEIEKHPNADRLRIARVETRRGASLRIVCGAPNIEIGQLVPVALVGAILPNGMEIKEAEVRGEKSCGMLCAEDELGMGEDHDGIMILDKKAKVGQNFGEYLGLKDTVYEVDNKSITHRPDLWSHYGIAREIAAFLGSKFKEYGANKSPNPLYQGGYKEKSPQPPFTKGGSIELKCKVEDFDLCPRYMAIAVNGIKIEDSPQWMQDRLIAAGTRPINNIVDITNYVLLELGQPLHAFDANLLGDKIVVRRGKNKEVMETLDGEKRELDKNDVVITDGKKPVAIGGVMGGADSEINNETKSIIIESANFNYISIRKTSQKLGLRTESSMRFEKGLDPNLAELALARTVELVKKLCPKARVTSNFVDEKKFKLNQGPIELNLDWLEKRIGERIDDKKVVKILESLGFTVETQDFASLWVTIPTWRATRDISIPEDLVEEIARIYGYGNLKPKRPKVEMKSPEINEEMILERKIKNTLSGGAALTEVYNYSFVGEEQLKKLNIDYSSHIRLANSIAAHQTLLRQSLAPNLINNIRTNQAKFEEIGIFEIGSVYFRAEGSVDKNGKGKEFLPFQEKQLAIAVSAGGKVDVFSKAKSAVEYLISSLDLSASYQESADKPGWAGEQACADIIINSKNIGRVAKLPESLARAAGVKKETAIVEISLKDLFDLIKIQGVKKYKKLSKYPPAVRDLAFVVDAKILYNDIRDEIERFNELISEVELFDVYQGEKLGRNKKSLAFHIIYQADRTLITEEVDELQKGLVKFLEKKLGARVRDF